VASRFTEQRPEALEPDVPYRLYQPHAERGQIVEAQSRHDRGGLSALTGARVVFSDDNEVNAESCRSCT
jgi:hypothetical protein